MTYPSTIKAIVLTGTGDFDKIRQVEVPFPEQHPDEILVKVNYLGLNWIDNYFRTGEVPIESFPLRLSSEAAGTILALPSDPAVLEDPDFISRGFTVGGKVSLMWAGAYAEYVSPSWKAVFSVPEGVSTKTAAAVHAQGITALTFVEEAYHVNAGDTVLIHTVAGGVGILLAQLAKSRGATVIGTTSTAQKAEIAKANGADHVILYRSEDVAKRVLEITGGEGVHAIFDGVGKDTFDLNFKVIGRKGTIVILGKSSGEIPPFSANILLPKNVKLLQPSVLGYVATPQEAQKYFTELYDLVKSNTLKAIIHKEYPFTEEDFQQAEKDLADGKTVGKLLVKVADE